MARGIRPAVGPSGAGEPHQPLWRKVLLLGVPVVIVLGFGVSFAWGAVADHYGRRIAADRAAEIEERARTAGVTAEQVTSEVARRNPPDVRRLQVEGTRFIAARPPSGSGDAHVVLRSAAWGGIHCIVLTIGVDGDISSTVRRCA